MATIAEKVNCVLELIKCGNSNSCKYSLCTDLLNTHFVHGTVLDTGNACALSIFQSYTEEQRTMRQTTMYLLSSFSNHQHMANLISNVTFPHTHNLTLTHKNSLAP